MQKPTERFLHCLTLSLGFLLQAAASAQETKPTPPAEPDANAWTVKTYRYPSSALLTGFDLGEPGKLEAPPMPSEEASPEEIVAFLRRSHEAVNQQLRLESVLLPKGSLAVFDPSNQTLVVRTTNALHQRIEALATGYMAELPKYLAFSVRLLEADGKVVREIVKECSTKSDHRSALAKLEALVAQGQAKHLGTLRVDTRSGQRATLTNATDFHYLAEQMVDGRDLAATTQEMRQVGTLFEVDPVLGPDDVTIDVNLSLEHHHAPPTMVWIASGQRGARAIESPTPHFHVAKVVTAIGFYSGMTKLVQTWKPNDPAGAPPADRLQMAFLKGDVVSLLPALDKRLESLLGAHGDKVVPIPKAPSSEPSDIPAGMNLRSFRIPRTFSSPVAPVDPIGFVAPPSARPTALEVLKAQGIPFPAGSYANYNPSTGELLVCNTPQNMTLVEAYVSAIANINPRLVVTTIHVVQADGATLRKLESDTATTSDHTIAWNSLEKEIAAGRAKVLRSALLETRSGQRATHEAITEYIYANGSDYTKASDAGAKATTVNNVNFSTGGSMPLATSFEMQTVGFRFELDPVIGPDGVTTDLNLTLDYDYAPPTTRREPMVADDKVFRFSPPGLEFHRANVTTAVTLHSGHTRLLGIWKPTGAPEFENADVLQAAFVRVDIVALESDEPE